jgi:hypothetical protein
LNGCPLVTGIANAEERDTEDDMEECEGEADAMNLLRLLKLENQERKVLTARTP